MKTKQELDAQWAELRRLGTESDLVRVVDELDRSLGETGEGEPRRRLKLPYVNATPLESNSG
jgi:hypothetical protein